MKIPFFQADINCCCHIEINRYNRKIETKIVIIDIEINCISMTSLQRRQVRAVEMQARGRKGQVRNLGKDRKGHVRVLGMQVWGWRG